MQYSEDAIVVPLSKPKIVLMIFISLGFVALGIWIWFQSREVGFRTISVACILFFGVGGIYGIFKLLDDRPGLVIDSEGVVDNSSGVAAGRIRWAEIVRLSVTTVQSQKFLTIIVRNPDKYVNRGGLLRRKLNALNLKFYGSPLHISSNSLGINFSTLEEEIQAFYDRYGQSDA